MVCGWYAGGMRLLCWWYAPAMRRPPAAVAWGRRQRSPGCYAGGMRLLCWWYAPAMLVLCACYAGFMRLLCACYASTMRLLCACYAGGMRLLCVRYASAMRPLCGCYAAAMPVYARLVYAWWSAPSARTTAVGRNPTTNQPPNQKTISLEHLNCHCKRVVVHNPLKIPRIRLASCIGLFSEWDYPLGGR